MAPYEIHMRADGSIDTNRYYARPLLWRYRAKAAMLPEYRRLSNGAIDYDYYRARSRRIRSAVMARHTRALFRRAIRPAMALVTWLRQPVHTTPLRINHGF
jgi:hypothetical protein